MVQPSYAMDLSDLPVDQSVDIDGTTVRLQIVAGGAVLSAELDAEFKLGAMTRYLQLGFSNALEFDAGLALDPATQRLLLTHWLAGVTHWSGAAIALESLLNQIDVCRTAGKDAPRHVIKEPARQRAEQRLRAQLSH